MELRLRCRSERATAPEAERCTRASPRERRGEPADRADDLPSPRPRANRSSGACTPGDLCASSTAMSTTAASADDRTHSRLTMGRFTQASAREELTRLRRDTQATARRLSRLGAGARRAAREHALRLVPDELRPDVRADFERAEAIAQRGRHGVVGRSPSLHRPHSARAAASVGPEMSSGEADGEPPAAPSRRPAASCAPLDAAELGALVDVFRTLNTWKTEAS